MIPEDLQTFGMIPKFVGRLPVIATLDDLSVRLLLDSGVVIYAPRGRRWIARGFSPWNKAAALGEPRRGQGRSRF